MRPLGRAENRWSHVRLLIPLAVMAALIAGPARPDDTVAECKDFFAKFEKCVDGLEGEQQEGARMFLKTLRGTLGMSDDLNQGDPSMMAIMCGVTMQRPKRTPTCSITTAPGDNTLSGSAFLPRTTRRQCSGRPGRDHRS
jgi:hypothetical protein